MNDLFIFKNFSFLKKMLLLFSLISLTACDSFQNWINNWTEYSTTNLASTISESNFSRSQQEELYFLLEDIIYARDCYEIQDHINSSEVLYQLELDYNLIRGFFFDEILSFNFNTILTNLTSSQPEKKIFLAIITAWKKDYNLEDIRYSVNQIKKCYPQDYF